MTEVPVRPVVDDLDTGEFFAAAGRGELAICQCASCGRSLHMPMHWCRHCGTDRVFWRKVRPTGRIHSYSVITHQVHPAFEVPYTLVLLDLDDAPEVRLAGRLDGRADVAIGDRLYATFTELGDGAALPQWHHGIHPDD